MGWRNDKKAAAERALRKAESMSDPTSVCGAQDPVTKARCERRPHDDETHAGDGVTWKDWDHEAFSSAKR